MSEKRSGSSSLFGRTRYRHSFFRNGIVHLDAPVPISGSGGRYGSNQKGSRRHPMRTGTADALFPLPILVRIRLREVSHCRQSVTDGYPAASHGFIQIRYVQKYRPLSGLTTLAPRSRNARRPAPGGNSYILRHTESGTALHSP